MTEPAIWRARILCRTWTDATTLARSATSGLSVLARVLPAPGTRAELLVVLPDARILQLRGVVAESAGSRVVARVDPAHEIDLIVLEQLSISEHNPGGSHGSSS